MSASSPRSEKPIKTTGMGLCGGLTVLLALGKVLGLWPWSWWHVVVPIMILLGFNPTTTSVVDSIALPRYAPPASPAYQ